MKYCPHRGKGKLRHKIIEFRRRSQGSWVPVSRQPGPAFLYACSSRWGMLCFGHCSHGLGPKLVAPVSGYGDGWGGPHNGTAPARLRKPFENWFLSPPGFKSNCSIAQSAKGFLKGCQMQIQTKQRSIIFHGFPLIWLAKSSLWKGSGCISAKL